MKAAFVWVGIIGGLGIAAWLWQIAAEKARRNRSDTHMWNAADEALCTEQRNKQLAETPPRSFGSLPTLDEFKQRAHR